MSQPVCKHFSYNLHCLVHKWATLYPRRSCILLQAPKCSSTPVLFAAQLVIPWMFSVSSLSHSISMFVCLSSFLFLHLFFSFLDPTLSLFLLICCVYVCLNSLCPKRRFFSHLSPSAKSSHPSGTYCSNELCQPSPVSFMNHFLFNFSLTHTCVVFTQIVSA